MNLSKEQRAIGRANFDAVNTSDLTRRQFLGGTLAAGAVSGAGLAAFYFGYHESLDKLQAEPVRVGVIGTGDEGSVLIGAHSPEYVDVVAICDIRPYNVHRAFHGDISSENALKVRPGLLSKKGLKSEDEAKRKIKVYGDYKEMLKDPAVEGVIIALPLHLHDEVAIAAMLAGKHVLTEKLMAHSIHQCKNMGRIAQKEQKILATGHQRHYSMLYADAVNSIKLGLLGDIHHIRAQWHRGNLPGKDSWQQPLPDAKSAEELTSTLAKLEDEKKKSPPNEKRIADLTKAAELIELRMLDKDVDAKKFGYQEKKLASGYVCSPLEELIRWRLWNRTGGGLMAELGSHQLDAAGIFCSALRKDGQKALPLTVSAVGCRSIFPEDREVDDHVYCMFEFPAHDYKADDAELKNKKIVVTYSSINGNGFGNYGEVVLGTDGTLILENETEAMLYKGAATTTSVKVVKGKGGAPTLDTTESGAPTSGSGSKVNSRGYTEEIDHWAWCIRNFDYENHQPKCTPKVAMADAIIALTSNIAIRDQKRIEFKKEWFDINSDETPEGVKPSVSA